MVIRDYVLSWQQTRRDVYDEGLIHADLRIYELA